jgi:hypothetical protein
MSTEQHCAFNLVQSSSELDSPYVHIVLAIRCLSSSHIGATPRKRLTSISSSPSLGGPTSIASCRRPQEQADHPKTSCSQPSGGSDTQYSNMYYIQSEVLQQVLTQYSNMYVYGLKYSYKYSPSTPICTIFGLK